MSRSKTLMPLSPSATLMALDRLGAEYGFEWKPGSATHARNRVTFYAQHRDGVIWCRVKVVKTKNECRWKIARHAQHTMARWDWNTTLQEQTIKADLLTVAVFVMQMASAYAAQKYVVYTEGAHST